MTETPTDALDELFARLERTPDVDAPELLAYDATDRLLLDTAHEMLRARPELRRDRIVCIGDRHGALTLGATAHLEARELRVHQDPLLGERALLANATRLGHPNSFSQYTLDEPLLRDAQLVLLQLPRSLDALTEVAAAIARWSAPDVVVLAGGRDKHMSRGMNAVLQRYFVDVSAGRGWRKSRVLTASQVRAVARLAAQQNPPFPTFGADPELDFQLAAFGATFGGPTLDHGSRLLLRDLASAAPNARHIVDVGCGNGVLATAIARARPHAQVIATDQSAAAVAATQLTAERAGVADRIRVTRADATEAVPDGWADLVLLNPPFHTGATVHVEVGQRLIRACATAMVPGAELRLVANSHLGYRPLIERVIGPTRQVSRDATYTVYSALRRGT